MVIKLNVLEFVNGLHHVQCCKQQLRIQLHAKVTFGKTIRNVLISRLDINSLFSCDVIVTVLQNKKKINSDFLPSTNLVSYNFISLL